MNLYQTSAIQTANDNSFGNDYIAGGPADDVIFGQLGNDVIQGDGSIDLVHSATGLSCLSGTVGAGNWAFSSLVGACRDVTDALQIHPSADNYAGVDGSDYIEGMGGSDVSFGNQGQDDLIGGSSNLFTLTTPAQRPDAPNLIFGSSGSSDILRNDCGSASGGQSGDCGTASPSGEAHDADVIVANNGDIVRLVGTGGSPAGGFLTHGYDTAAFEGGGNERIVPRAVTLLDYTPGGPDLAAQAGSTVTGDIGAGAGASVAAWWYSGPVGPGQALGSEVHGGQGDDTVYGGSGDDVLFGDGQNDVLIGGYGNDWISGGTGDDGALGDDGRIFVSRVGTLEPLYGIGNGTATGQTLNQLITTPGTMQQAVINTTGAVRYTAVLAPDNLDPSHAVPNTNTPSPKYASDIIYGGLAHDALHGGAGDDAMSGAEAPAVSYTNNYDSNGTKLNTAPLRSDFNHPFNPGNVLGYSPTLTYQAQYDPNDPFREVTLTATGALDKSAAGGLNWLLNFSSTEGPLDTIWVPGTGYAAVATDGNDATFGDLGNDWLVGGTGRDTGYGGWGNDLLNADDVLNTGSSVTNIGTDTNPSYEDVYFGGAGRDVMIANTGGDRLIDWIGEFDSYLTPFAPFGMATVSRTVQPQLPEYLYALSVSDGADPFLAAHYASDPTRDGEPFGELGIVLQHDVAWGDQRGKPRDPQAGNSPGAHRDLLRTAGIRPINSPDTDPPVAGAATVVVAPAAPGVQMAAYVDSNVKTAAPLVITGAIGALARYTISNGATSVSGSGTIGADGKVDFAVDVSSLADGTLTVTATLTLSGLTSAAGTTTTLKDTALPASVGLALPGYVGLASRAAAAVTLIGDPGNYIIYELDGPGGSIIRDGYLDSVTGKLTVTVDLTFYADGEYSVTANQYSRAGNASPVQLSTPTVTLDSVAPTGTVTATTLTNSQTVALGLSFADDRSGVYLFQVSADGGITWSAWQAYAATATATMPSPDGAYTILVRVSDKSGNTSVVGRTIILDRTGPSISAALATPNNGTAYDVGTPITLTWAATDPNGVRISSASIEGQTISSSGGTINVDLLTSGTHTVTISATDIAGNVTTRSITFTVRATPQGILNSIIAAGTGSISASFKATLITQMQQVIKGLQFSTANGSAKMRQFISQVQNATAAQLSAAYKLLLLNWCYDALSRM